jgi:Rieske Fe-S protein
MTTEKLSRRTLGGLAAAGLGLPLLAACGSDDSGTPSGSGADETSSAPADARPTVPVPDGFATTEEIPVGGGTIYPDLELVVTQPAEGEFKCFTAICSHAGCIVSSVSDTIFCRCHESEYDIETGDVVQGPARFPLQEFGISVSGDSISLA